MRLEIAVQTSKFYSLCGIKLFVENEHPHGSQNAKRSVCS